MKDLYKILGVSRDASETEIKSAYRSLAKKLHPDLNSDDKATAERFKEVSSANAILTDPDKRARYDRGEIDASGAEHMRGPHPAGAARPRSYGFEGFRGGLNRDELFAELFGKGRRSARKPKPMPKQGEDKTYSVTIDFLEAANGTRKRLSFPGGKTLDVRIPAAVRSGQQIRLKGQGGPGSAGGKAGDALVEVTVSPHAYFSRKDNDIHLELPITLQEAILGARITLPTIHGDVTMAIPRASNTGQVLRLKGKGLKGSKGAAKGSQYVTLKVVLPDSIDKDLDKFISRWASGHDYGVRGDF